MAGKLEPVGSGGRLLELSPEVFERVVKVHLFGAFHCPQLAAREMVKHKYGRIIVCHEHAFSNGGVELCER
ncbi:MAG: SDR family NAD(P)-dependent oxidoreductase [Candidatus Binataceae bacterium]